MLKFAKVLPVKSPSRGTPFSAGIDFYVPENTNWFHETMLKEGNKDYCSGDQLIVRAHERINIPSGIKVNIPHGFALIAFNKSGVALKKGLDVGATVIDEDYQGVIHLSLTNTTNREVYINYGEKIIQFLLLPINYVKLEEVKEKDLYSIKTLRGEGGFGSTGIK